MNKGDVLLKNELVLGTLGDSLEGLTCSMYVARKWNKFQNIRPYSKFELAAEAVKKEEIYCFLVPAAYPNIKEFIMDSELIPIEIFIEQIPPLVYVEQDGVGIVDTTSIINNVFLHPATEHLLREIYFGDIYPEITYVDSNVEACKLLCACYVKSGAITNQLCADKFNLKVKKNLRSGIKMPWICFAKTNKAQ